jgi:hypothetical protein
LKRGGASPEEEEMIIDSEDGSQVLDALDSRVMYPPLQEGDAGEVSGEVPEKEEVVIGKLVEEEEEETPKPEELSSLKVSERQAAPERPASSRVLSARREPTPQREPTPPRESTLQREPTPPKSATQVEEELVFEEETETPESRRSSLYVPSGQSDIGESSELSIYGEAPKYDNEYEEFLANERLGTFTGEERLSQEIQKNIDEVRKSLFNIFSIIKRDKQSGILKLREYLPLLNQIYGELKGHNIKMPSYQRFIMALYDHIQHLQRLYDMKQFEIQGQYTQNIIDIDTMRSSSKSSSMGVVPPPVSPPARVLTPQRVLTPPARVPTPPARVLTPPITADNRQAIIDIARIYVKPVEGARTPTSLERKLYEFGLNL